jgi:lipopolysaccharide transport system ATP-binding protein
LDNNAITLHSIGKMYKLYRSPADQVLDAFSINRLLFWRKKYFREFWALRGLSLEVKKGERLGIIGRNGAGKSTLLKIIAGIFNPTEGDVTVKGNIQALMEMGTSFHPEFTGRQNIGASLSYQGFSRERIAGMEEEIIEFAELGDFIDQPLKTYSVGMGARLAFSTATAIVPEILIIDEVLGAGDAYFAGKSLERMRRLTEDSGATVLFVSHDLGSVQQICNRVIWIDRGRVVAEGTPLEVTKTYYASILRQEERRLKARNARMSHQDNNGNIEATVLEDRELLGRINIADAPTSGHSHPIRRLTLSDDADFQLVLEPGMPMDNDRAQPAYLLEDPYHIAWSEPQVFLEERIRCVEPTEDNQSQASFAFMVPEEILQGQRTLRLEIEHAVQDEGEVSVEIFNGETYGQLGILSPTQNNWETQSWQLPPSILFTEGSENQLPDGEQEIIEPHPDKAIKPAIVSTTALSSQPSSGNQVILENKVRDKYYSAYCDLLQMDIVDHEGQPQVMFDLEDPIGFKGVVQVFKDIPKCGFSVSIYALNGSVVTNLYWPFEEQFTAGKYSWNVMINNPNLRQGEYIVSCGIIEEFLTTTNETVVFYCKWTRFSSFRIEETYIGNMPLGMVLMQTDPPLNSSLTVSKSAE